MFRSALLASVGMLALSTSAPAQMAVFDGANFANTARSVVQGAQQIQQLTQQLATMQQQYNQLVRTYQAVAHLPQQELTQLGQQYLNQNRIYAPAGSSSRRSK